MTQTLLLLAYLYFFWTLYVLVMGFYRAHLNNRLTRFTKILSGPWVIVGVIFDASANIFIATFVFMELPREWLVTTRLTRYQTYPKGYKKKLAEYICDKLLDPFDPTGNHC